MKTNRNIKNKIILNFLLRLVFVLALSFLTIRYFELSNIRKYELPIKYSVTSAEENSKFIIMKIEFQERNYKVDIEVEDYNTSIIINENPTLYYSKKRDFVFSNMQINQFRAWAIVTAIFLLISFIPFNRISRRMDEAIKRKYKRNIELNRLRLLSESKRNASQ